MKILKNDNVLPVFAMANITPKRSGLPCNIWSPHKGVLEKLQHNTPRVKVSVDDVSVSVSIEEHPEILAQTPNIKKSDMAKIAKGMDYVGRNHDLFLMHYNDCADEFDDEDLFNALRSRGEYR